MRKITVFLITSVVFFAVNCASTVKSIPSNYAVKQDAESVILGQIAFPESELLAEGSKLIYSRPGYILVKNTDTGGKYKIIPDKNGKKNYFFISLPKGKYQVVEINWEGFRGEPKGIFIIDENNKTIYVGTIILKKIEETIGQKVTRWFLDNISGTKSVPIVYSVIDNFDDISSSFRERYPDRKDEIEKSLMIILE